MHVNCILKSRPDDKYLPKIFIHRHVFHTRFNISFGQPTSVRTMRSTRITTALLLNAKKWTGWKHSLHYYRLAANHAFAPAINIKSVLLTADMTVLFWQPVRGRSHISSHRLRKYTIQPAIKLQVACFGSANYLKQNTRWSDWRAGKNKNFVICGVYEYLILTD